MIGRTFITGVSEQYDDCKGDKQFKGELLNGTLSEQDYRYIVGSLNVTLKQFWPCDFAIYLGYILAPFCFFVSLMLPYLCIKDAKEHMLGTVKRMNVLKLQDKGLLLTYR